MGKKIIHYFTYFCLSFAAFGIIDTLSHQGHGVQVGLYPTGDGSIPPDGSIFTLNDGSTDVLTLTDDGRWLLNGKELEFPKTKCVFKILEYSDGQIKLKEIPCMDPLDYSKHINDAAKTYNIDPLVIKAMLITESRGNPGAKSSKGATGLLQIMPATAKGLGIDPTDPAQNIHGGAKYLRQLLDSHDQNLDLALAAYNAGPTAVKRWKGIPPFVETQNYVKKVRQQQRVLFEQEVAGSSQE